MDTFLLLWYAVGFGLSVYAILTAAGMMGKSFKWRYHAYADVAFIAACGFAVFPVLNFVTALVLIAVCDDCKETP